MTADDPVVRPVRNARTPALGRVAVLAASDLDAKRLAERMQLTDHRPLYLSRLYYDSRQSRRPALVGPLIGAPYAAMVLEVLRAWGVRKILFYGWCGSIAPDIRIGDVVIPTDALIDEGTSGHYQQEHGGLVHPDPTLSDVLRAGPTDRSLTFKTGRVWTTDGIFRETPGKITEYRGKGAHVVEMEFSALLSVAAWHAMAAAGILAVSDELFTMTWQPGFKHPSFVVARDQIIEHILAVLPLI